MINIFIRRRNWVRETPGILVFRGKAVGGPSEKVALCKPTREASEATLAGTLIWDF